MQSPAPSPAARVVRNWSIRSASELVGKLAAVALFAVMARELGRRGFGEFTYAAALAGFITSLAGVGTDDIVARSVAQRDGDTGTLVSDVLAIKLAAGGLGIIAIAVVAGFGDYAPGVRLTLLALAASALVDLLTQTAYAVFQGLGDLAPESAARLVQLVLRTATGVAVLLAGGGAGAVGCVYLGTSLLAMGIAARVLAARVVLRRPRLVFARARTLTAASFPIALAAIINAVIFSTDTIILSALKGNAAVGLFGAASRLVEGTIFLGAAFVAAVVPALAVAAQTGQRDFAAAYETSCKALLCALLPVSLGFLLFAHPVTRLVFGSRFGAAESAVRLLAPTVLLVAISTLSLYALVVSHRQSLVPAISAIALFENVVLAFVLVPSHSFDGAAGTMLIDEVTYVAIIVAAVLKLTGPLSGRRIALGPIAAACAMTAGTWITGTGVAGMLVAVISYLVVLTLVERRLHPLDFERMLQAVRRAF